MSQGVAFITTRDVPADNQDTYRDWTETVAAALQAWPGFLTSQVIPSVSGERTFWTQIATFDSKESAAAWERSPQLAAFTDQARAFSEPAQIAQVRTGESGYLSYGLDVPNAPSTPAKWKQLLAALTALYPTVFVLTAIQELIGLELPAALKVLLTNAVALSLVLLVWMPMLSKALASWLSGQSRAAGMALVLGCVIVVMLVVFSIVQQLWL